MEYPSQETSKTLAAVGEALLTRLQPDELELLLRLEREFHFSFQRLKLCAQWLIDCRMWDESRFRLSMEQGMAGEESAADAPRPMGPGNGRQRGERIFTLLQSTYGQLAGKAKVFSRDGRREKRPAHRFEDKELKGRIFRLCPAASEKAVCCNLKVLNIVDNCAMACSYCVLQNHYDEAVISVPTNLKEKLAEIQLDPAKRYRITTGEYSDSLLWGNRNGILQDLCDFARMHPNIILELKTKSVNIGWLLENDTPANLCCSWSLNPQLVISNEEHKTPDLERRLEAARKVADKGIKVGFHIHPMMYFEGWQQEYQDLIGRLIAGFRAEEVLWVSLGCVTLAKGLADQVRLNFESSRLLQMEMEQTPDGKWTYAFEVREQLYRNILKALEPWKGSVFRYLCMEHAPLWEAVMGFAYPDMRTFDDAFNDHVFAKIKSPA